jgi:hypothetical protein
VLLTARRSDGRLLVDGKTWTGSANDEEQLAHRPLAAAGLIDEWHVLIGRTVPRRAPEGARRSGPTPGAGRKPRSAQSAQTGLAAFEPIQTLERLRELRQAANGFIVITDTANPPRLHSAGCRTINEGFFVTKVIENGGRNGAYLFTRDADAARARWPRLRQHTCA